MLTTLLVTLGGVLAIILLYGYCKQGTSKPSVNNRIPGPSGIPVLGNLFQIIPYRENIIDWIATNETLYGPLFTYTIPLQGRSFVINHPKWLEHVKKSEYYGHGTR